MENRQIHNEVHRQAITGARSRRSHSFVYRVGAGYILAEPVTKHETYVRLRHVLSKLHGNAYTNAIALGHATDWMPFIPKMPIPATCAFPFP